jgi:hypothetical protein
LWNYAETICFKTHGLIREFHGPYTWGNRSGPKGRGEEILVRDFICLNPAELWEECRQVPFHGVRVAAAYEGLDMTVDIYNNVTIREGGRYIDGLRSYYVEGDGKILSLRDMHRLCDRLSGVMISITSAIEKYDWRKLAEKYAEIFWFAKKELRDELGLDWTMPGEIKERIRRGELNTRLQNLGQGALQRMLRIAF